MNLADIQGLVFHAYRRLPYAAYVLMRFQANNNGGATRWLAELVRSGVVDSATPKDVGPPGRPCIRLNVALTYTGLGALGLDDDALQTFPLAFAEGLGQPWANGNPDHRSRVLGDVGASEPARWEWGYQGSAQHDTSVDALLLIFATDPGTLDMEMRRWIRAAEETGAIAAGSATTLYATLPVDPNAPIREPFGFVDGISQPILKGARGRLRGRDTLIQPDTHELEDGELLLGHRDGNRQVTWSPRVVAPRDPNNVLREASDDRRYHDLGYNGTYLVFRQLAQDVQGFHADCEHGSIETGIEKERFAAMLVGRWQDGSPLIKSPIEHDPALARQPASNDFDYSGDPYGERCPMGAHIRRANPRDSLGDDPKDSLRIANRHRILRRGRPYCSDAERGLHFVCLNADIVRQFEFVQQNWINDATFGGLENETDPIAVPRRGATAVGTVTLPPPPESRFAQRASGLGRYVTVRGGGYFFLPSLTALRYLAGAPAPQPRVPWHPVPASLSGAEWIRFLSLTRFSILLAALLAALPLTLVGHTALRSVALSMFLVRAPWELLAVSLAASLTASMGLTTWHIVDLYAQARFNARAAWPTTLTWRRVFIWQAASLPIVVTMLVMSARDTVSPWREGFWFGVFALLGYGLAFLLLFLAAAVRSYSVRGENPQDSVLIPACKLLAWLKHKPTPFEGSGKIVGQFFRAIESRAATWPVETGAGYVNHENGRVLPGHLAAAVLVVSLIFLYLAAAWPLNPKSLPAGFQLPPLAYLLFLLLTMGWAAATAAFFLDRFRVPLLTAILVWLMIPIAVHDSDHEFPVIGGLPIAAPAIATAIASGERMYHDDAAVNLPLGRPVIAIAAGGGGIQQAAWTIRVLTGLTDLWGPAFTENVRFISGVSAGSVAAMHFLMQYDQTGPHRNAQAMVDAVERPSTGDIYWGVVYPDLMRTVLPFSFKRPFPAWRDRGWALDQSWYRALGHPNPVPTMGKWMEETASGRLPAAVFNAMAVENGQRVLLATYELPDRDTAVDIRALTGGADLSAITAARLSASFPYITPFARVSDQLTQIHVADGGYWDNYGLVSLLEWLKAAKPALNGRKVLIIRIPPSAEIEQAATGEPWVWQAAAPLMALASVRTNGQKARNELEINQLTENWGGDAITPVEMPFQPSGESSLAWRLSRREEREIDCAWRKNYASGGDAVKAIAKFLGAPALIARPPATECP
jgi:Dyp-type peroxidase family